MNKERLTTKLPDGTAIKKSSGGYMTGDYIDKLSAYEDSGLTPREVMALAEENKALYESFLAERKEREVLQIEVDGLRESLNNQMLEYGSKKKALKERAETAERALDKLGNHKFDAISIMVDGSTHIRCRKCGCSTIHKKSDIFDYGYPNGKCSEYLISQSSKE